MERKISGSKVASRGVEIKVVINDEVVHAIAKKLAIALTLSNNSISSVLENDDAEQCFAYSLYTILSQNSGAKPSYELVPAFLSDISMPLDAKYRGVVIHVKCLETSERPHSYDVFLDVLQSLGLRVGKVLRVDPNGFSNVLLAGTRMFGEAEVLVGVEVEISIEELVVRAMLNVQQEEQDKLNRIIGYMDNMYLSRDELVRNWACSLPVGNRA